MDTDRINSLPLVLLNASYRQCSELTMVKGALLVVILAGTISVLASPTTDGSTHVIKGESSPVSHE